MIEETRNIYTALAELLGARSGDELPDWFFNPGGEWKVFNDAVLWGAAGASPAMSQAVVAISEVPSGSTRSRWGSFWQTAYGKGGPKIWLYESQYVDGRCPGPVTFQVKAIYDKAGLAVDGPELPDHAAVELAFLALLVEKQLEEPADRDVWRKIERIFIKNHAGKWLPRLGRGLARSGDAAWHAVGLLLEGVFERGKALPPGGNTGNLGLPWIREKEKCSLCGFCTQACPTQALQIYEDEAATSIGLHDKLCVYCGKCAAICPEKIIGCQGDAVGEGVHMLFQSPRAICPSCGKVTVSLAELKYTAARLGFPEWLAYCQDCR